MRIRKTMTEKQLAANRENAKNHATGPKTQKGKDMSKLNAIKEGCYCKDLYVPEKDRGKYLKLEEAIKNQLQPTTALLRFAVRRITAAVWRCKLALQLEARYFSQKLSPASDSVPEPEKPTITEWYAANTQATAKAIKLIDTMIPYVRSSGHLHPDWEESVKIAFGADFYEDLVKWETAEMTDLMMAETVRRKSELFRLNLIENDEQYVNYGKEPTDDSDAEEERDDDSEAQRQQTHPEVPPDAVMLRDPKQQADLMVKLLEAKRQQLLDTQHIFKHLGGQSAPGQGYSDSPHRFVTSAFKELEKAVHFHQWLLEVGL